ncbi:MAG: hypothetical protein PHC49_18695 [Desulfuromonadaceae bacterium]|nr:hypothetical protein [Desulfuromonadaceae bacterium]
MKDYWEADTGKNLYLTGMNRIKGIKAQSKGTSLDFKLKKSLRFYGCIPFIPCIPVRLFLVLIVLMS